MQRARAFTVGLALVAATLVPLAGAVPASAATDDVTFYAGGPAPDTQPTTPVPLAQMPFTVYAARIAQGGTKIYVRDLNAIISIDPAAGTAQRVAGAGWNATAPTSLPAGIGLDALAVNIDWSRDFAVAPNGDLEFAAFDSNNAISRLYAVDAATQTIKVVAGSDTGGYAGDGGAATSAQIDLGSPGGGGTGSMWTDASGRTWFLQGGDVDAFGQTFHHMGIALRRVDTDGTIHTVAGDGTSPLSGTPTPTGVAATGVPLPSGVLGVAPDGHAYFLDNTRVLRLETGGTWTQVGDLTDPDCAPPAAGSWFVGSSAFEWVSQAAADNAPVDCHLDLTSGAVSKKPIGGAMHDVLQNAGPERVQESASFARLTDGSVLFTGIEQNPPYCVCIYRWEAPSFTAVNHPPTAPSFTVNLNEDQPVTFAYAASDPDGDPVTVNVSFPPGDGTLTRTTTTPLTYTYTPGRNFYGEDFARFHVVDSHGAASDGVVAFEVAPVADKPTIAIYVNSAFLWEGTTQDVTVQFADPDGEPASNFTATADWGDGSRVVHPKVTSAGPGFYNFPLSHRIDDEGTYKLVVTVVDSYGGTARGAQTFKIVDAPIYVIGTTGAFSTAGAKWGPFRVACVNDDNPIGTIGDLDATIHWGDGSSGVGKLVAASKLTSATGTCSDYDYGVTGSHTWTKKGTYSVKVTVVDVGGEKDSETSSVKVN